MQADKVLHFCAGAIIMALAFIVGTLVGAGPVLTSLVGMFATVGAAGAKEWYDGLGFGTPDTADFWVTVAGGIVAGLIITLLS